MGDGMRGSVVAMRVTVRSATVASSAKVYEPRSRRTVTATGTTSIRASAESGVPGTWPVPVCTVAVSVPSSVTRWKVE